MKDKCGNCDEEGIYYNAKHDRFYLVLSNKMQFMEVKYCPQCRKKLGIKEDEIICIIKQCQD